MIILGGRDTSAKKEKRKNPIFTVLTGEKTDKKQ